MLRDAGVFGLELTDPERIQCYWQWVATHGNMHGINSDPEGIE